MIFKINGLVLLCLAVLMLMPLIAGLCFGENVLNFVISIAVSAAAGGLLASLRPKTRRIYARDGFVAVGLVGS